MVSFGCFYFAEEGFYRFAHEMPRALVALMRPDTRYYRFFNLFYLFFCVFFWSGVSMIIVYVCFSRPTGQCVPPCVT